MSAPDFSGFLAVLPVSPKYQTIFCGSWTRASLSLTCWTPCGSSAVLAPTGCLPSQPPPPQRLLVEGQARCQSHRTDSSGVTCRPLSAMLPRGSRSPRPLRWQLKALRGGEGGRVWGGCPHVTNPPRLCLGLLPCPLICCCSGPQLQRVFIKTPFPE